MAKFHITEIPDKNSSHRERAIRGKQNKKRDWPKHLITTMEMATKIENRTDRRRRIMSREIDRMALITGRLRNLPPSPPPSPSSPSPFLYHQTHQRGHSHTGISPSFFSKDIHANPDSPPLPNAQGMFIHSFFFFFILITFIPFLGFLFPPSFYFFIIIIYNLGLISLIPFSFFYALKIHPFCLHFIVYVDSSRVVYLMIIEESSDFITWASSNKC